MPGLDLPISELELPPGFAPPKLDGSFDAARYIQATPVDATVKGMFLKAFSDYAERAGKKLSSSDRFYTFNDVPLRQALEMALETAELVHPELPLGQALRTVGQIIYPTFASSMIGKVIFGAAGKRVGLIYKLAPKAIDACLSHGKLEVERPDEQTALLRFSDTTIFTEAIPVGMAEGVLDVAGVSGSVATRVRSLTEVDMFVRWG
jgi:uncharacterized protein (TIGR02265 family)